MKAIRVGRLIDGTGTPVQRDSAVYVDAGQIVEIGPLGEMAADVEVVDLTAYTVLPGLIDCHVHLCFSAGTSALTDVLADSDQQLLLRGVAAARQALGAGITTVRDLGGRGGVIFALRDGITRGIISGPRILAAGSPITITGGHCNFLGLEADGELQVRAAARAQLKAGADCLKIMATGGRMTPGTNTRVAQYSVAELRAAVEEAQRANVTLAAHALGTSGIRNAVAAGVNTIEHCNWLSASDASRVEFDEAVALEMRLRNVAVVATLTPLQRSAPALCDEIMECMRRMRALGVVFVAGTDAGVSLTGFESLVRELEIMVSEIGFTPLEAIHAATGGAARVLLRDHEFGTLVPGRAADLVAVDGDPSSAISTLRKVRLVMKAGEIVARNGIVV